MSGYLKFCWMDPWLYDFMQFYVKHWCRTRHTLHLWDISTWIYQSLYLTIRLSSRIILAEQPYHSAISSRKFQHKWTKNIEELKEALLTVGMKLHRDSVHEWWVSSRDGEHVWILVMDITDRLLECCVFDRYIIVFIICPLSMIF